MDRAYSKLERAAAIKETYGVKQKESHQSTASVGISQFDLLTGGLPHGNITEIFGPQSSGRTAIMLSTLAVFSHTELCVLVDTDDGFDVKSAFQAGAKLENLLWAKCSSDLKHALEVTDVVLRSGSFGFVVLDLVRTSARDIKRIQQAHWLRFRRAIENTSIVLLVIGTQSFAQSLAGLVVELRPSLADFRLTNAAATKRPSCGALLQGANLKVIQRRPFALKQPIEFRASVALSDHSKIPP